MEDGLLRKKKKKKVWRNEIAAEMTKGDGAVVVFMEARGGLVRLLVVFRRDGSGKLLSKRNSKSWKHSQEAGVLREGKEDMVYQSVQHRVPVSGGSRHSTSPESKRGKACVPDEFEGI